MTETTSTAAAQDTLGRPAPGQRHVIAALFVDFGGNGRPPRARYECVPCNYASPIATGADAVTTFVATAADEHRTTCINYQEAS
ncbi:hypothetical protein [Streptomyces cyaneofuscatus]|uniref:hypothetical protein n=1 Tax=Streptomyces cyaneofuscatus TaxID=66883 RepID=UPI0037AFB0C7